MRPEPLVLGFDTSAAHCAAALLLGDRVLAEMTEDMTRGQAERLFPILEQVLSMGGHDWADLDAIGVGIGPGNFTGIRISVSAARGLSLSLGVPAVGVSGFDALAYGADGPVLTSIDGRRDQVYLQQTGGEPFQAHLDDLPTELAHTGPTVIGHGAERLAAHTGGTIAAPAAPVAAAIAAIAGARAASGQVARPAPLYLRAADAAPAADQPPKILT
ncbi:tRNA (adenosine(37)-N6)-threonylcarbamoyltransferase complex dimerization subunit type 1 TsaB [Rhodovulum sp. FJ3]|uniref:tRNA (adenosine(37)-N6)-threonylcarbamoyltransferase complex dimerization subunit type 1 TsaB n=1 Tax=Rhodovulum sp. FJ3 TaxID=3079053 RepID=UPI00293DB7CF|nr:tRNA (adenosine(37)-N6)-threonylcarbamoyltransferase complex dimerization subunit type 1 TsaB [Rhodovulum sp. FJ3]MDV4168624.1 tRNA (adenosine(37)-N6)-threonylcarbamoyltransferase complex dimerization subunit type 1 TsaB [Rhodovulum sp. FJ3]